MSFGKQHKKIRCTEVGSWKLRSFYGNFTVFQQTFSISCNIFDFCFGLAFWRKVWTTSNHKKCSWKMAVRHSPRSFRFPSGFSDFGVTGGRCRRRSRLLLRNVTGRGVGGAVFDSRPTISVPAAAQVSSDDRQQLTRKPARCARGEYCTARRARRMRRAHLQLSFNCCGSANWQLPGG